MKLDAAREARVRLGDENVDCPGCPRRLRLWRPFSKRFDSITYVSCFTEDCVVHAQVRAEVDIEMFRPWTTQ